MKLKLLILRASEQSFKVSTKLKYLLGNLSTIYELCQGSYLTYFFIDRLIHLVLILPISTVTTKKLFSTMKIVTNKFGNMMENDMSKFPGSYERRENVWTN